MVAPEIGPPDLLLAVGKAQAREWNGQLDLVALIGDPPFAGEDRVEGDVLAAVAGQAEIALNAQGIDEELVSPPQIAVGIQHQTEVVVGEDIVAVAQGDPHLSRIVVGDQGDVEVVVVVGDPSLGVDRRSDLVARADLREAGGAGGLAPTRVIEESVYSDGAGGAFDGEGRQILGGEVGVGRGFGGDCGGEQNRGEEHGLPGGEASDEKRKRLELTTHPRTRGIRSPRRLGLILSRALRCSHLLRQPLQM